jgi:hypothetical protein
MIFKKENLRRRNNDFFNFKFDLAVALMHKFKSIESLFALKLVYLFCQIFTFSTLNFK